MSKQHRAFIATENEEMASDPCRKISTSYLRKGREIQGHLGKLKKPSNLSNVLFINKTTDKGGYDARELGYKNVVLMNFANRHHAGGGYLRGAAAQEEDLCRCFPQLYRSLYNTDCYSFGLSDVIVTEPTWCVRESSNYKFLPKEKRQTFHFVSAAAPNVRYGRDKFDSHVEELAFKNVLLAPLVKFNLTKPEDTAIVLGAWGCGAFGNEPEQMAKLMKKVLKVYGGNYGRVIFAVPSFKDRVNYDTFKKVFGVKD